METRAGRLAFWSDGAQLVGGSYNRIKDCVARGHKKHLHFVNFDKLTNTPKEALQGLYNFLGEPYFEGHDFENVAQSTHEKDEAHGFVDLHTIRSAVRPVKKDFLKILEEDSKPYLNVNFDFIKSA